MKKIATRTIIAAGILMYAGFDVNANIFKGGFGHSTTMENDAARAYGDDFKIRVGNILTRLKSLQNYFTQLVNNLNRTKNSYHLISPAELSQANSNLAYLKTIITNVELIRDSKKDKLDKVSGIDATRIAKLFNLVSEVADKETPIDESSAQGKKVAQAKIAVQKAQEKLDALLSNYENSTVNFKSSLKSRPLYTMDVPNIKNRREQLSPALGKVNLIFNGLRAINNEINNFNHNISEQVGMKKSNAGSYQYNGNQEDYEIDQVEYNSGQNRRVGSVGQRSFNRTNTASINRNSRNMDQLEDDDLSSKQGSLKRFNQVQINRGSRQSGQSEGFRSGQRNIESHHQNIDEDAIDWS